MWKVKPVNWKHQYIGNNKTQKIKKLFKLSMSKLDGCDDARQFYLNMISVTVPNWKRGHDKIQVTKWDGKVMMVRVPDTCI